MQAGMSDENFSSGNHDTHSSSLLTPPFINNHNNKQKWLGFFLFISSSQVWTGPILCDKIQSHPTFMDTLISRQLCLTCMCAYLSFLACHFVLGMPHYMWQRRLRGPCAELLKVRLSDVTPRQLRTKTIVWKFVSFHLLLGSVVLRGIMKPFKMMM